MQQSPPEPSVRTDTSRRQVVVLSAVTVLTGGALAACGGSDNPVPVGAAAASPADDPATGVTNEPLETSTDPSAVDSADPLAESESDSGVAADETTSKAKTTSTAKKKSTKTSDKAADKSDTTEKSEKSTRKTSSKAAASKSTAKGEDFAKGSLIKLSKVPVGGSVKVGSTIVTRTGSNSVVGLSTVCTHQGCAVAPQGAQLVCPCHDSRFNNKTGAVLGGPAPSPLPKVGLVVKGGYVHPA